MGLVFDLILADDIDLERMVSFATFPEMDIISTKILDPVTLAQLHVVTMNRSYEEVEEHYTPILEGGLDGPCILVLPTEFVFHLADLNDSELEQVVQNWSDTEEIQMHEELTETWVQTLVRDIQRLASRAKLSKKKLFLRCSL